MKRAALSLLLCSAYGPLAAQVSAWPPQLTTASGGQLVLMGNLGYDALWVEGSNNRAAGTDHAHDWRRQEIGFVWLQPGRYEVYAGYDTHLKGWADVGARIDTQGVWGRNWGKWRIGQSRLPVGMEGSSSSRAVSFIEGSLMSQAFHQSRRIGVDWAGEWPQWLINTGYYVRSDLNGNHKGETFAARLAWTPRKSAGDVFHVALVGSRENPHGETNGHGQYLAPTARLRARAGTVLTGERMVDSGLLQHVQDTRRTGVELLWIGGPWSVQGEYLRQDVHLGHGAPSYRGHGRYVFASWVVTGESRGYASGGVANPVPTGAAAWEILWRYDQIDLDDAGIQGGHATQWTLGTNAYVGRYLKFQANYLHTRATRAGQRTQPRSVVLRAQFHF